MTSVSDMQDNQLNARNKLDRRGTYIPSFGPMSEIVMIHAPLQRDMLPNTDRHVLWRVYIYHWRLARVGIWDPYHDGEPVC